MTVQRIRVKYGRKGPPSYISHLDMMRMWQRAFRRADIPLAMSEGQVPRLRFSLAAPLAVGVSSEGEIMDVFLKRRLSPFYFLKRLVPQMPAGIEIMEAVDVPLDWPSLQSQVQDADYRVTVETTSPIEEIEKAVHELLARETLPWEHQREAEIRRYDLRAQVHGLRVEEGRDGEIVLGMTLKTDPTGSGRPEQVVAALGLPVPPKSIHRTRLRLADLPKTPPQRARSRV